MPISSPGSSDPWIGSRLGDQQRYRLDRRLGGGAVGDVYLAMDVRLGRRVAIKILKGALAKSKELLARFEREVALSVALESEHIVQVIDYGVAPGGYPFYVMEYLQGQTLSQWLARMGRLSVEQTVTIAIQLCAGLKVAHEGVTLWKDQATVSEHVKVIHRDLKPANIFLVDTAIGKLVKILDFGIAKKLHTNEQAEQTNLTQAFLGTFRYAAPEQLRNAWKLDERADVYSLGIILYEMLSGTDPYGITAKAPSQADMSWAMAHASVEPTPLRRQPGCEQIPAELEAIVMRCLRKPAGERFASVTELSQALSAVSSAIPTVSAELGGSSYADELAPTVSHPLAPAASTIYRPIAQQRSALWQDSTTRNPSTLENSAIDPTVAPSVWQQPSSDQTILQEPSTRPQAGNTQIQATLSTPGWQAPPIVESSSNPASQAADATLVQSSSFSVSSPSGTDATIVQSPSSASTPSLSSDGTIVQSSAQPKVNPTDATIAQTPSYPTDATLFQPRRSPSADATVVDNTIVQGGSPHVSRHGLRPNVPPSGSAPSPLGQQQATHHPSDFPDQRSSHSPPSNDLRSQASAWLRSSAFNYSDRLRSQASSEMRHTANRFISKLLPMSVGFLFGLVSLTGAYVFLRSKGPHLPSSTKSFPSLMK